MPYLDNGDDIIGRLTKFGAVDVEMIQLIPLCTLIDEFGPGPDSIDAFQVCSRIEFGIGGHG